MFRRTLTQAIGAVSGGLRWQASCLNLQIISSRMTDQSTGHSAQAISH
jgi:hypothetical protein